jgi:hypothetical protein
LIPKKVNFFAVQTITMMNTLETQNYLNSNNNFGPVQQPVTVNHGIMSMTAVPQFQPLQQPLFPVTHVNPNVAHVVPIPQAVLPMQPIQQQYTCLPNVSAGTDVWYFTPSGLQQTLPVECVQNGNLIVAPQGWSFMPREEFFNLGLNMAAFPTNVTPLTPSPTPSVSSSPAVSRSTSIDVNVPEQTETTPKKTNIKRAHRAKQTKIAKIHAIVKDYCVKQGIFANEDEVLRGMDVLRIHVKTWEGLDLIEEVIQQVERSLPIARIALPFSMKNKFQKKGFICYLKVQNVEDVSLVQSIFGQYSEAFKKCDVALPTSKVPEKVNQIGKPVILPFKMSPPTMLKRSSAA